MTKQNGTSNPIKEKVDALYNLMKNEGIERLELKDENFQISLKRKTKENRVVYVQEQKETAPESSAVVGHSIKSPIIGMFYRSASPSSPAFVEEGDVVEVGKTLCIVEAMKVMNEIKADARVKIVKILVENGKAVSVGQDIFVIEKL
ncbi:MAG: hypothetical protein M0Q46_00275 [Endomicrobiales bacterium]|nr:hypothetical protein [Endomicrobiales bacterium]